MMMVEDPSTPFHGRNKPRANGSASPYRNGENKGKHTGKMYPGRTDKPNCKHTQKFLKQIEFRPQ